VLFLVPACSFVVTAAPSLHALVQLRIREVDIRCFMELTHARRTKANFVFFFLGSGGGDQRALCMLLL
jgi:hypothetical protein